MSYERSSKPPLYSSIALALLVLSGSPTAAATVNIDAKNNCTVANAVAVPLPPGTYAVRPVDTSNGGLFTAWNAWSSVSGCDTGGANCSEGWLWSYNLRETGRDQHVSGGGVWQTKSLAFATAVGATFTLTSRQNVRFYIDDIFCDDNTGGISLAVDNQSCAVPGGGAGTLEEISGWRPCGRPGKLRVKWGSFGRRSILRTDLGEMLELECLAGEPVNTYRLWYTNPRGDRHTVGQCPWEGGCNKGWFRHTGDNNGDGNPDCLLFTRWLSKDFSRNDEEPMNPWGPNDEFPLGNRHGFLDHAVTIWNAQTNLVMKWDLKWEYALGPPVPMRHCGTGRSEGQHYEATKIDPPLGPETEAFFDEVLDHLQLVPPGEPMQEDTSRSCDLDGSGQCDEEDFALFQEALGGCLGDSEFFPIADLDGDGCLTVADQRELFSVVLDVKPDGFPNSLNPDSRGMIPVAVLTTGFSLNAGDLDVSTARFGSTGTEAAPLHHALEDIDGDGDTDLILHFRISETSIACGETTVYLIARTSGGETIRGVDSVRTVGCG